MRPLIHEIQTAHTPESLAAQLLALDARSGLAPFQLMLLRTLVFDSPAARYSYLVARPFLTFRSFG